MRKGGFSPFASGPAFFEVERAAGGGLEGPWQPLGTLEVPASGC